MTIRQLDRLSLVAGIVVALLLLSLGAKAGIHGAELWVLATAGGALWAGTLAFIARFPWESRP